MFESLAEIDDYQDEIIDEGAKEKRAFIVEPEFARVLKVISREGNTLSAVIRDAWDTDRLQQRHRQRQVKLIPRLSDISRTPN